MKTELIQAIVKKLQAELDVLEQAAAAAYAAATNEESKAEDQYDTRGLEASYLASAQANRATELKLMISKFQEFPVRVFASRDKIAIGALLELESGGKISTYFLAGIGGGVSVELKGKTIQVITTQAPLGAALLGKSLGDSVEITAQNKSREYVVEKIS